MKSIDQLTNQTLATLESPPIQPSKEKKLPISSPEAIKNPCRTDWQRKWLALDCYRAEIQGLADAASAYCFRWFIFDTRKSLLVLAGESGCGKTHCANAIYNFCSKAAMRAFDDGGGRAWREFPRMLYVDWPHQVNEFKSGNYGLMQDMLSFGLLVLDDIGAEHDPSKNGTDHLCQILSQRERKFTVITTNIKPEFWPEKFDTRIADRLLRNSEVVRLFGVKSYTRI